MAKLETRSKPYKTKRVRWTKFKKNAVYILNNVPLLKRPILRAWRTGRWLSLKSKLKIESLLGGFTDTSLDVDKTYYVSPHKIKYCSLSEFDIHNFKGKVMGGDWDHLKKEFEELDIFVAFREVCVNGNNWDETVFYNCLFGRLAKGEILWDCKDKSELDKRCVNLGLLYNRIKKEGYRAQTDILFSKEDYNPLKSEDEITVSIGKFGDLLFSNGAHRLAIAKLLKIDRIPIRIAVRHPQWLDFRKEILLYCDRHGGKTYQSITHPDLSNIPAFHKSESRFMMIKRNLTVKKGKLLDIGANWGYFCHKFEDEGFDCYAIEHDPENLYFSRKLRRAENKHFKIISKSILEWNKISYMHFDVALALNIFHHFLKKKTDYSIFVNLLRNLKVKEMFFEPHSPNEAQMNDAYKNLSNEEFVDFILHNSMLNNAVVIGKAEDERKIYKLW